MRITRAEHLYLQRRRMGLTQAQMATRLEMKRWEYQTYEAGQTEIPARHVSSNLKPGLLEQFILKRRRRGWTQEDLAEELGVSRIWVNKMEGGSASPQRLVDFWADQE